MNNFLLKLIEIGGITHHNGNVRINVPGDGNCGIYATVLCLFIQQITQGVVFSIKRMPKSMEECRKMVLNTAEKMLRDHNSRTNLLPREMTNNGYDFKRELESLRDMHRSCICGTIDITFISAVFRRMLDTEINLDFMHGEGEFQIIHCPGHFQVDVSQEIFDHLTQNSFCDEFEPLGNEMYQYFFDRKVNNSVINIKRNMGATEELKILEGAIKALESITGLLDITDEESQMKIAEIMSFLESNMQPFVADGMLKHIKNHSNFMKYLNSELKKMRESVIFCKEIIDSIKIDKETDTHKIAVASKKPQDIGSAFEANLKRASIESNILRQQVLEDEIELILGNIDAAKKAHNSQETTEFPDDLIVMLKTGIDRCNDIKKELSVLEKELTQLYEF